MTHRYSRGQYLKDQSDPHVEGMVVLTTGNIGYDGYRVAEKDTQTGVWRRYWIKAGHLHDEVAVDAVKPTKTLSEADVTGVETQCSEYDTRLTSGTRTALAD